ncbi:hypothetical protein T439DRAFT_322429 [Meredithblackwellia eburnea MCA 4105]
MILALPSRRYLVAFGIVFACLLIQSLPIDKSRSKLKSPKQWLFRDRSDEYVTKIISLLDNAPVAPYRLMACSMVYNEGQNMLEWMFYHMEMGIQHFVVYDHHSTDHTNELLLPLVELGWVTYVNWTDTSKWAQPYAFENCQREFKTHTDHTLFFDTDEFIVRNATAAENEMPFLDWIDTKFNPSVGGIAIPRLSFSSNGHYTRPEGGVLAAYTETRIVDHNFFSPKILGTPRYLKKGDQHNQEYTDGRVLFDSSGNSGDLKLKGKEGYELYFHHYWAKSYAECQTKILQAAFPGSWRFVMGDKFCRMEMAGSPEHDDIARHFDERLAKFGPPLQLVIAHYHNRFPAFNISNYPISFNYPSSARASPFFPPHITEPLKFTIGNPSSRNEGLFRTQPSSGDHLLVMATGADLKRHLSPTQGRQGPSYTFPTIDTGAFEITAIRTYANEPDPTRDPISPCSIIGHLNNQPTRPELLHLQKTKCAGTDLNQAYSNAIRFWPHPRYRGEQVAKRFVKVDPVDLSRQVPDPSHLSLEELSTGRWKRSMVGQVRKAGGLLHVPATCPRWYDADYWTKRCGNLEDDETRGVWKWVPDKMDSFEQFMLPTERLTKCLTKPDGAPRRILVVGDSVSAHNYMAISCHLDQSGISSHDNARFFSLQYEMFSIMDGTFTLQDWERILRWDPNVPGEHPDVVLLNIGLWPVSWSTASDFARGMQDTIQHLKHIQRQTSVKILWRTTTATSHEPEGDPLSQVTPRVELLNRVSTKLFKGAGFPILDYFEPTVTRHEASRDNAHYCPQVQGELAQVALWAICSHLQ